MKNLVPLQVRFFLTLYILIGKAKEKVEGK